MKKKWKQLSRMLVATIVMTLLLASNVFAAVGDLITVKGSDGDEIRYTEGTIDTSLKTSLAIYKYEFNGDNPLDADGHYTSQLPEGAVPLEGAIFTYYKIADLVQTTTEDGTKMIGLKYHVGQEAAEALGLKGGEGNYSSDELNAALEKINASGAEEQKKAFEIWVKEKGSNMDPTGPDGKTKKKDLDQGLYLIVETEVPGVVSLRSNPFLVSLPMTNVAPVTANGNTFDKGALWQYDVTVQPKNKVERPDIDKNIVEGDNSDKFEGLGIGDTITYQIRADIPKNIPNMSKYEISDAMSKGLTFDKILSIQVDGNDIGNTNLLTPGVGGKTFTLQFIYKNNDGAAVNALKDYPGKEVLITYTAILNENAVVTPEGNPNDASLDYNHNTNLDSDKGDVTVENIADPAVYTYGIDLSKVDENGQPLAGVEFEIYRGEETGPLKVREKRSSNADYANVRSYYVDSSSDSTKIITGENGQAYIYGLAPGTYYLKETKAAGGHNLLQERIKVVIKEDVTYEVKENGTYLQLPSINVPTYYRKRFDGTYVPFVNLSDKAGQWVNFGTNSVYLQTGEGIYTKAPGLSLPSVKVDIEAAEPYGASGMTVQLKIKNNSSFKLPQTGGVGTYIFVFGGAVIALAACGLILISKKRRAGR